MHVPFYMGFYMIKLNVVAVVSLVLEDLTHSGSLVLTTIIKNIILESKRLFRRKLIMNHKPKQKHFMYLFKQSKY